MTIHDLHRLLSQRFRHERMRRFFEVMAPDENTRILDLGGYPWVWAGCGFEIKSHFTMLNIEFPPEVEAYRRPEFEYVIGDATHLDYADGEFDIVFSNSVIEHVGTLEKQIAFANEAMRVGKRYWIQTPAKEFPIEPHLLAPFIHWLPKNLRRHLIRNWTVWGWMTRPGTAQVESFLHEIRLLDGSEFRSLFPTATILTERAFLLPKSYTACKS